MIEPAERFMAEYLPPETMSAICFWAGQDMRKLAAALSKERSFRERGKPFDMNEVTIAMETCARALWQKSREMRGMMRGRDE